jgi:hypothetical protein
MFSSAAEFLKEEVTHSLETVLVVKFSFTLTTAVAESYTTSRS